MSDESRARRDDPEREGPDRRPGGAYSGAGRAAFDGFRAATDAFRDVVEQGVRMGYRVVEEQIEQGRQVASQVNDQVYGSGPARDDVREVTDRMFSSFADMTSQWFDFMGSMFAGGATGGSADGGRPVSVRVSGGRPTRVTLTLDPAAAGRPLEAEALRAEGSDAVLAVTVEPEAQDTGTLLSVTVDGETPAGAYRGALRTRQEGRAAGELHVEVAD